MLSMGRYKRKVYDRSITCKISEYQYKMLNEYKIKYDLTRSGAIRRLFDIAGRYIEESK